MSSRLIWFFTFLLIPAGFLAPVHAGVPADSLLQLCSRSQPGALAFVRQSGAEILPIKDGRTFFVWHQPEGFDPARDTVFVSMHGHGGWAARDFQVWYPHLKNRGYAFLGIQWWYGHSEDFSGYASPQEAYRWIREMLEAKGIPPGHVLFSGFSRGAANSYAVTYHDRLQKAPYFGLTLSIAGEMADGFPPNRLFLEAPESAKPLAGARWILYCGEQDTEQKASCGKMQRTKEQLEKRGAVVDWFIRDPKGGHGGFMVPSVAKPALDLADKILLEEQGRS